jgi:hypothetical protein
MNFDKRYWWFIGTALLFQIIAEASTFYIVALNDGMECAPVSSFLFAHLGMLPTFILYSIMTLAIMIIIPYICRQNSSLHLLPCFFLSLIAVVAFLDALNNMSAIFNIDVAYNFAHTIMTNSINTSSAVFGDAGKTLC